MRLTTKVWAKFESKGRPSATLVVPEKEIGLVAKDFLMWLCEAAMGHYIRVTIARTEAELEEHSRRDNKGRSNTSPDALLGDFEKALEEMGLGEPTPPPPSEDDEESD